MYLPAQQTPSSLCAEFAGILPEGGAPPCTKGNRLGCRGSGPQGSPPRWLLPFLLPLPCLGSPLAFAAATATAQHPTSSRPGPASDSKPPSPSQEGTHRPLARLPLGCLAGRLASQRPAPPLTEAVAALWLPRVFPCHPPALPGVIAVRSHRTPSGTQEPEERLQGRQLRGAQESQAPEKLVA